MKLSVKNIVWKEGEFFVAQCLNVEVSSFGETKQEALSNLKEVLEFYFEDIPFTDAVEVENPEIVLTELEHA